MTLFAGPYASLFVFMAFRSYNVLSWNVRGLNSQEKHDCLRAKIQECASNIICIQETKRESFDSFYISKFCPRFLKQFAYHSSVGASCGLLMIWSESFFLE